jgi:nucleoid-associated protein EbfC
MFGNMGNIGKMMQIASQMKTKMPELQKKLAESEYSAQAGGGVVSATVTGKMQIVDVSIDPSVFADGDVEMLEDLIKAAVSAAQTKAAEEAAAAMKELTGGMEIPGMTDMLGM